MKNLRMICFDMDGTVADLYGVDRWLEKLRDYDPSPYREAKPMWDTERLTAILNTLSNQGVEIRIITWLSKESNSTYDEAVRKAKREWLEQYNFPFAHFHGVAYGATKADSVRKYLKPNESAILVDDNAKVRKGWHLGETIDPTACDILEILEKILEKGLTNQA